MESDNTISLSSWD